MVFSLALFHTLFNFNQAIIMQYVYRKRHHGSVLSLSSRNLFMGEVRVELKIVRITNVIMTPLVFFFPFQEEERINWLLMTFTMISTFAIAAEHSL